MILAVRVIVDGGEMLFLLVAFVAAVMAAFTAGRTRR